MHPKELEVRSMDMGEDIELALRRIPQVDPPVGLFKVILLRISQEKAHAARVQFGIPAFVAAVSFIMSVSAARYAFDAFSQSSFLQYFSLAFSDGAVVAAHWQAFLLSLAETIPFAGVAVLLATVFVLLYSTRIVMRNLQRVSAFKRAVRALA